MMNFKSNYKLPLSFILFFVLTFFLIGEQLPALPTYLIGPGLGDDGPDKVHILDLPAGDALHRPFAYLIIGVVIWGLFRIFAWPIAWVLGASLWAVEQLTLTPLDQRSSISNLIFFTFTFWVLFTLVPYFIFRWVDKKWGRKGIRNAILIVLGINILVFSFFVLQIYGLNNSHRGFSKNTGQQGSSGSIRVLPQNTCPERLITEKDKQTVVYWHGKILPVSAEEQKWVEANCPGVVKRIEQSAASPSNDILPTQPIPITSKPTLTESPREACRKKGPTCNIVPGTNDCYCYDPKNCETPDCKME